MLETKGDAHDGDAHQHSNHIVDDGNQNPTQNEPEEIPDGVHGLTR
jgi:hypothetical protein